MNYLDLVLNAKADPSSKTFWKDLSLETRATDPTDIKTKITSALKSRGFLGNTDGVAAYIASKRAEHKSDVSEKPNFAKVNSVFADFPDGIDDGTKPLKLDYNRVGVISDLHLGLHDKAAILTALEGAKRFNAECLYINGDFLDCYAISRHDKTPGKLSIKKEIELAKQFLGYIREMFPDIDLIVKSGNHEDRLERFVLSRCPELVEIFGWTMFDLCQMRDYGAIEVKTSQISILGKLHIAHGHEGNFFAGGANPARSTRLKAGNVDTLIGHVHRVSSDIFRGLNGEVTRSYSTGCLAKLSPEYCKAGSGWQHGYALLERDKDEVFVQNIEIR